MELQRGQINLREHATALHNSLEHSSNQLANEQTTNACARISRFNQKSRSCARIVLLQHQSMKIPYAYSREGIPANQSDIATPETASNWEHLKKISRHLHYRPDLEIGMLIGQNVPTAFQPLRIIYGKEEEPWAEEYKFGWTIISRTSEDLETIQDQDCALVNRITVCEEEHQAFFDVPSHNNFENNLTACFATKCNRKDTTSPQQIREMMQLDYNELHYSRTVRGTEEVESVEDQCFTRLLSNGIHQKQQRKLGNTTFI